MTLRWSHAVLYVRDLAAMLDFYEGVLGFSVTDRGQIEGPVGKLDLVFLSQVDTDHHQIAFAPGRGEGRPAQVHHMAFRVDSLTEVQAVAARLQADGRATSLHPVNHGNAWSVYFSDPEGNGIEVFCDSPFHVRQPQGKPWDLATTEAELRARTEAEFGGEPDFGPIAEFYARRRTQLRG